MLWLMLLVACAQCLDWQASGNLNQGNLTTIMMKVDEALDGGINDAHVARNISDALNGLWDRFWNVCRSPQGPDQRRSAVWVRLQEPLVLAQQLP